MAASHCLRVISASKGDRLKVVENLKTPQPENKPVVEDVEKFIEHCRQATYAGILAAFCQGLGLISKASDDEVCCYLFFLSRLYSPRGS